jgi:hypothetical protein
MLSERYAMKINLGIVRLLEFTLGYMPFASSYSKQELASTT